MSHPVWVCGLKLYNSLIFSTRRLSHPVWVCGLKHRNREAGCNRLQVTPCMGVWIETLQPVEKAPGMRHTLYGCVD